VNDDELRDDAAEQEIDPPMRCLRGHMHPPFREIAGDPPDAGTVDEDHHDEDCDAKRDLQEVEGGGSHFNGQLCQGILRDHAILVLGASGLPSNPAPVG
jgi:hypothetical protein